MAAKSPAEPKLRIMTVGSIMVDLTGHCASIEGRELDLTRTEFNLLAYFVQHPWRVLGRAELLDALQLHAYTPSERTIDAHVKNLRAKLGDSGRRHRYIQTVYGVGYRLANKV